ncbi:unnamed protein product [Ostreobium quekettii]|uniref:Cullin family profile domain-containing protein n=1 Tax=Ostreobium quekettii TaxID=121088 RepID=A0A8S1IWK6_9CHLO|nr:unnamed protein product [Ostreobium quekettii]|eukprot:evm.model.scf_1960.1 EVM.evm.TU.scf_1960.1   scf_1960:426-8666(+)
MSSSGKNKRIHIEPFKHPPQMHPHYAEQTWKVLEDAIEKIHNHNASKLSFEELYRNAYNMVLHRFGDKLYMGLINTLTYHLHKIAAVVESAHGESFLRELKNRWDEHQKSTQMIRDILMYMDRTYVQQNQKTHVYQLGLDLWCQVVVRNRQISERLRRILLELVHKERTGEVIDRLLMRSVIKMFTALGKNVYVADFEEPFLSASAEFYKKEANEYISSSDCPEYLRKAERRLTEEKERVGSYLDASSMDRIVSVVQMELILNQMKTLIDMENSGGVALLRDNKYDDLYRMYCLFGQVQGGLELVKEVMANYVKDTGRQLVQDPERSKDPVGFVQGLLDLREKYELIIKQAFKEDRNFRNALNQAFEHFVNLSPRSPEYISLFIDEKLRKGIKDLGNSESDLEALLDKVMTIFRFLQEKDVFEKYYKQHLAKRLLSGRSFSDDAERSLLVKLKTECGYQFTSKLESMFNDIKTSEDMMRDFKDKLEGSETELGLELSVQVLTTGSWPAQATDQCLLPRELEACCEEFQKFYLHVRNGRRLTWQTNMGTAELKFSCGGRSPHILAVSTYQACVLMLFNDSDRLTYQEIADASKIPPAELKRNLQSLALVKGKNILVKEPMSKEVNDSDVFTFNDKFQSKFTRIKIGTVTAQKESEPEKHETRQKVEEDRKPQIEAAIVRIMKARRVLDHNSIVTEVTHQLAPRFNPNPSVIKKRIESLIEREFLERDQHDRKLYRYLA